MVEEQDQDRRPRFGSDLRVQLQMGSLLRQVYGSVITEPVPDRFSSLLEQLSQKTKSDEIAPGESTGGTASQGTQQESRDPQ